jgi:hypothetical protein
VYRLHSPGTHIHISKHFDFVSLSCPKSKKQILKCKNDYFFRSNRTQALCNGDVFVFAGQLPFQGTLNTLRGKPLPPLKYERGALCVFSCYQQLVLRAVVAPAYQVILGLCIPEVKHNGACIGWPLL